MMRWIIGSSLRFRFLVVAVAATMVFLGLGQLRQLPVDVFPEFAPPRVEIQTACIGLSASEVEALVTTPMEETWRIQVVRAILSASQEDSLTRRGGFADACPSDGRAAAAGAAAEG
jgi:Cu/Ag efflux pump CusA